MKLIPALAIGAGVLVTVPFVIFVAPKLLPPAVVEGSAPEGSPTPLPVTGDMSVVDSAARIEIELLRGELEAAKAAVAATNERIAALESELADVKLAASQPVAPPPGAGGVAGANRTGPNDIIDQYAQVVLVANRRELNQGLTVPTPSFLTETLGAPREDLSDDCQPMTNPRLAALLRTEQAGPIPVTMLQPALDSLRRVFANVEAADPDLYARINTSGSLCVRRIRGSRSVSTHSFGLAVDLNIDGQLDTLGDGRTQLGLTILADFFNAEGWVWGAAYGREDSMHFEVARETVEKWVAEGLL